MQNLINKAWENRKFLKDKNVLATIELVIEQTANVTVIRIHV